MSPSADPIFLGLDSSTQSLKATAINQKLETVFETALNFDKDLPRFATKDGVHRGADGLTVTSPTLLWVAALDLLLERLKAAGFPFERVASVSGSGQQHGSVYWKQGSLETLKSLDPKQSFESQLGNAFAVKDSPIWMDSSTTSQCRALEDKLGGPQAVAELTGSRAYERFTGNQIAKVAQTQPEAYAKTERISLVSSFVASLFLGEYAAIDSSDGAGMNLMDIRSRQWAPAALDASAPGLGEKLGPVVPSHQVLGPVSGYLASRFGFSPNCQIIAFSGDNPCSLAGLRLQHAGEIAISLGTSDTVFAALSEPKPSASEGHIFANPVDPAGYMALVCYKNGSLTREEIRDRCAGGSWDRFNAALQAVAPGNDGRLGFYRKEPEITPPILSTGAERFDGKDQPVGAFTPEQEIRAVLEGQFLSIRLHGANIGIQATQILATGGASANPAIVQVMADVFGVPVYKAAQSDSASLGAAYRALHGWRCGTTGAFVPFADVLAAAPAFTLAAQPDSRLQETYTPMLERYRELEQKVIAAAQ